MSGLESIGRAILSLALVVGLMWLLGRWARGRGRRKGRAREGLEILARQPLNRNASVAVVRINGRAMVLGVTETQVTHLGDLAADEIDIVVPDLAIEAPPVRSIAPAVVAARRARPASRGLEGSVLSLNTWSQAVNVLRDRTVRH